MPAESAGAGPPKQGWGETHAKSDGTFPSDGSHLVDQGEQVNLYDQSEGHASFRSDRGMPNIGAPTVGGTGQYRNDDELPPLDKTKITE